jgi:hypothetical protein
VDEGRIGRGGWGATAAVTLLCGTVYAAIAARSYEPHTFLFGDCPYYAASAVSLLADGDLRLENNIRGGAAIHAGNVSVGTDGAWRPKHPVLMPVVSIPFLVAFGVKGLLAFNVLMLAACVGLAHRLALRGASAPAAAVATTVTGLLTFVVTYSYNYSPDAFAAVPALLAMLFLLDGRPLPAGLAAGVAFAAKPVHALLLAVCGAFAWRSGGWRAAGRYACAVAPAVLAILVYNLALFGGPLTFSYDRILSAGAAAVTQRDDVSLSLVPGNLRALFVDPQHGLVFTAPSALVALAGIVGLWRRRPLLALLPATLFAAYVAFLSAYAPWMTSHFGNRFLFPAVLASALPLAALLDRVMARSPRAAAALATTS